MLFMGQSRSLLLASFCVEAVAVASTFRIPTVGSHYPYYILLALTFRVMVQRLLARKTTSKSLPLGPLPFRLLMPVVAGHRNGFFGRTDGPEDGFEHQEPRSSVPFVPNPESVADTVRSRGGR